MKKTQKPLENASFQGITIRASLDRLLKKLGKPDIDNPKYHTVQYEWDFETEDGDPFCVYDWREYWIYDALMPIEWRINAPTFAAAQKAKLELEQTLETPSPTNPQTLL